MENCILNGTRMSSRAEAHAEIARALELPPSYGANLDALWDVATTTDANLVLVSPATMLNALGVYGCKLLQTLFEAAAENPGFHFQVQD